MHNKSEAVAEVTAIINNRFFELVDPIKLLGDYERGLFETAIKQLYDEGTLTPDLVEPLVSVDQPTKAVDSRE